MKRCLNENEIAHCAEYITGKVEEEPTVEVMKHLRDCLAGKMEVLEVVEIIADI